MEYKITDSYKLIKMEKEEKYLSSSLNENSSHSSFVMNRHKKVNDFLNKFSLCPQNILSKNDFIWKDIISTLFGINDSNANSFFQRLGNEDINLKFTSKEYQQIEKKKRKYGENKMNLLNILKIKNKQYANKFKQAVLEGIPNELRGLIWKIIIDPLHSYFDSLAIDIVNLCNLKLDNNNNDQDDFEIQNSDNISVSSCYLNTSSNSNNSIECTCIQENDDNVDLAIQSDDTINILHFLANNGNKKAIKEIENDLDRTLIQFEEIKNKQIRQSMKNILSAYSAIDKDIDFTQGMSFLAGLLLCNMDEFTAFNCFCTLMLSGRFNFREYFIHDFPGVYQMNKIWNVAIQKYFPKISLKLTKNNIDPVVYTVGWWLTAFSCFPFQRDISLLIFDRYLLFGPSSLISFGLIILNVYNDYMKNASIDDLTSFLQSPHMHPKMNDISYVRQIWNKKFLISKKQYNSFMLKASKT